MTNTTAFLENRGAAVRGIAQPLSCDQDFISTKIQSPSATAPLK
jgi:hypothetical protein